MSATGHQRGHPIEFDGKNWVYRDTGEPTADNRRACAVCHLPDTPEGHDPCLGTLPGVMNACCGHGVESDAYIQLNDGTRIAGKDALDHIQMTMQLDKAKGGE